MRKLVALLAGTLIVAGCSTQDRTQELQQQRLTLELMKAQTEQLGALKKTQDERLAELAQKEERLRALEKTNQQTLQEIEQQKASLESFKEQMRNDAARLEADAVKLNAERKQLEADREKVRADELKNQHAQQELATIRAELDRKLSVIRRREEAERQAKEPERQALLRRQAEEQKRQKIIADRTEKRKPLLDQLAADVITQLDDRDPERPEYRKIFCKKLLSPEVAGIEEDRAFLDAVRLTVLATYKKLNESRSRDVALRVNPYSEELNVEKVLESFDQTYDRKKKRDDLER
jgi:hypothetical protein